MQKTRLKHNNACCRLQRHTVQQELTKFKGLSHIYPSIHSSGTVQFVLDVAPTLCSTTKEHCPPPYWVWGNWRKFIRAALYIYIFDAGTATLQQSRLFHTHKKARQGTPSSRKTARSCRPEDTPVSSDRRRNWLSHYATSRNIGWLCRQNDALVR